MQEKSVLIGVNPCLKNVPKTRINTDFTDYDVVFGMEATGIYSLPLYSALKRDGYKVKLYNPIQTNGYRKINIRKTKTDTIDSAIIAEMLRHRLIEKQALCKVQIVRNIDTIWPDYGGVMKRVFGAASLAILKKHSVPSKLRRESFEQFYERVKKKSRSKISRSKAEEIYANGFQMLRNWWLLLG